jgi:hypothetical protein
MARDPSGRHRGSFTSPRYLFDLVRTSPYHTHYIARRVNDNDCQVEQPLIARTNVDVGTRAHCGTRASPHPQARSFTAHSDRMERHHGPTMYSPVIASTLVQRALSPLACEASADYLRRPAVVATLIDRLIRQPSNSVRTMSSSVASTASDVALPSSIHSLLSWAAARLESEDVQSDAASADAGVIPGAPLCAVRSVSGQGFGVVLTQDVDGAVELMRATPKMQLRTEDCAMKHLLPKDG